MVQFLHVNPQDFRNNPVDYQEIAELGISIFFICFYIFWPCPPDVIRDFLVSSYESYVDHVTEPYLQYFAMVGPNLPSAEPDGCSVGAHEPPAKVADRCGGTGIRGEIEFFGDHLDFTKNWLNGSVEKAKEMFGDQNVQVIF